MKRSLFTLAVFVVFNLAAEIIPVEPGTVIASKESLKRWQAKPVGKKSAISRSYHGIALRHYAKSGNGKFIFSRKLPGIDCSDFDLFIYEPIMGEYTAKPQQTITGFLETDCGTIRSLEPEVIEAKGQKFYSPCVVFDVSKAKIIKGVRFEITLNKKGIAEGMLWRGLLLLRNNIEHNTYMKHYRRFAAMKWQGLIQPESYQPEFKLQYEILFSNADLKKYRRLYGKKLNTRKAANVVAPEAGIAKNTGGHYRSSDSARRDLKYYKNQYRWHMWANSQSLSFEAILSKDKELMRMAARYILSTATFDAWNDLPRNDIVGGGVWPAFTPSTTLQALALGLDFAGEMLTPRGRDYVLKTMVLKGIGPVTYSLWRRNQAFKMNQAASFLRGKVLALCVMDKVWPRVTPMLENSKRECDECMSHLFKNDGSYMESVGYLAYTTLCATPIYEAYSRFAKKPLAEVIPECMRNFGGYAEVVASTCKDYDQVFIPLGQSTTWSNPYVLNSAFLAAACPNSMWVNIYKKIPKETKADYFRKTGFSKGIRAMKLCALADKMPEQKTPRSFVELKQCGLVSSLREFNGKKVKIVAVGDAAGVGKKAYDTSNIVLEFAGDPFAMQMVTKGGLFFESQYRNMTVPILKNGMYAKQKYLLGHRPQDDRNRQNPVAGGDAKSFKCEIDASFSWTKVHFKEFTRTIDSPSPDVITICDSYTLGRKAVGAAFMLISYLPIKINGGKVVITGNHGGSALLSVSDGCKIKVEKFSSRPKWLKGMNMKKGTQFNRLIISKDGKSGDKDKIIVKIKLMTT